MNGGILNVTFPSDRVWNHFFLAALGILGVAAICYLLIIDQVRVAVALTALTVLIAISTVNARLSIIAAIVYLVCLGDLRRILIPVADWSGRDPLLLVGPTFGIILFSYAWASGTVKFNTPLAKWILVLMGIMALQILNPRQGGLMVGIAGAMFLLTPLIWFWVGRTFATRDFMHSLLFRTLLLLGIVALLMGLYQSFFGYLPYQLEWYNIAGYSALGSLGTTLAPISLFSSGTEHNMFLVICMLLLWSSGLTKNKASYLLVPVFLVAVIFSGSRGPVATSTIMLAGLWAIRGRSLPTWFFRGGVAVLIAILGLYWSLASVSKMNLNSKVEGRVDRQAREFVHAPRGEDDYSSGAHHLGMLLSGYEMAFKNPLGHGIGSTTKAAGKFGGRSYSTETDLGNSFYALGLPGGVVYHIVVFLIILTAFKYWLKTRSLLAMAILSVLGGTFFLWLGGGNYGINPIIWICVGALDRFYRDEVVRARDKVAQ